MPRKKKFDARFDPRSYPKPARESVRIDYAHKLSQDNKAWLANFNESEYGGNPDHLSRITGKRVTAKERREKWKQQKRRQRSYQRDTMSQPERLPFVEREGMYESPDGRTAPETGSYAPSRGAYYTPEPQNPEDALIELIDKKHELEAIELHEKQEEWRQLKMARLKEKTNPAPQASTQAARPLLGESAAYRIQKFGQYRYQLQRQEPKGEWTNIAEPNTFGVAVGALESELSRDIEKGPKK